MTDSEPRYGCLLSGRAVEAGSGRADTASWTRGEIPMSSADEFSGWTPLLGGRAIDGEADGAIQTGDPLDAACTAVLLAYGADPKRPSRDGPTPLHLAFQVRHELAVRLLEAHIALRRPMR